MSASPDELRTLYERRFEGQQAYRQHVWRALLEDFFQRHVPVDGAVLDLGCGHGEFINQVRCRERFGMDLNPATAARLAPEVRLLAQDCSRPWALPEASLDVVFTSNFFEHLPHKQALADTLAQAHRCLKPGGRLIALGPNIKYLPGRYWDFWDHHLPLTELSLREGLQLGGFEVEACVARFLPYTMSSGPRYPLALLRLYLRLPVAWRLLGRQFLLIARRRAG
jgi:SAM-dependent methyltransferase